jgi:hypothetical protein
MTTLETLQDQLTKLSDEDNQQLMEWQTARLIETAKKALVTAREGLKLAESRLIKLTGKVVSDEPTQKRGKVPSEDEALLFITKNTKVGDVSLSQFAEKFGISTPTASKFVSENGPKMGLKAVAGTSGKQKYVVRS